MFKILLDILKKLVILAAIITALIILGNAIANYLPWIWLTYFFVIIRHLANLFGFLYDLPTMWTLVGWSYILLGIYYVFNASIIIIKHISKPS